MPTYNFANVIDDHIMEITHIIRGNEFLSSTPKYNLLYEAFGWEAPEFIHVTQIMRDSTHKLSKRDGDAYFTDFTKKGFLVPAIINYIALLGWAPKGENEIFSLDELVEEFNVEGLSKSPALFDPVKMKAINGMYIRLMTLEAFKEVSIPYICQTCKREDIDIDLLCKVLQPRTEILTDIPGQVDFIDKLPDYDINLFVNKKMKTDTVSSKFALIETLTVLEKLEDFSYESIHNALLEIIEKINVKNGHVLFPLRVAVSGKQQTPGGGAELCVILGKEESLARIRKSIEKLS
ncbi:glutamate--trna ligase [Holotrichia oblita]|nr:glutamate--trna ligase [Holotrichia oblita]